MDMRGLLFDRLAGPEEELNIQQEFFITVVTDKIAELMQEQNISRKELAEKLGVKPPYITKLLSGEANMTLKTLVSVFFHLDHQMSIRRSRKKINLEYKQKEEKINNNQKYTSYSSEWKWETNCIQGITKFVDNKDKLAA